MKKNKKKKHDSGRNPSPAELREADRVASLDPVAQENHPSSLPADPAELSHINTYGELPRFYIDRPFICRKCGKREIWRAADQKWYFEEAKGHIDARAVECHGCRTAGRRSATEG